jgi:GNAT superfamily N-acetyltransferase
MTMTHRNTATGDDVGLSLRQFSQAWRLMCTLAPAPQIVIGDGIEYIFSGCPVAFFNVALVTGRAVDDERLRTHAEDACAWAADKGVPWLFVVTHETLNPGVDATAILDRAGFVSLMPLTGMVATQVTPVAPPSGLELTVPPDDASCAAAVDVNSAAYSMDLEAAKALVGRRAFWANHFIVLGHADGKPASTAAVMMVDGLRYVALVATDPGYQRRGFGDAAMRRALELSAAAHGEVPTVLHATEAGRPVYERMGYVPIAAHTIFMEKRFAEGH